jgi:hypothetical protein
MIVLNGLGAIDRSAAASFCGQKFGVQSQDFQPCVEFYAAGKPGDYTPIASATGGGAPWWQSALTAVTQGIVQPSSTLPVPGFPQGLPRAPAEQPWYTTTMGMGGIAAGALVLFLMLKK